MFQIHEMTEVHLATFTKREETHGDEKVPAVSITVELTGANTLLDSIDPTIRHALYKPVDDQDQLPGVEPATPVLRCNSFEKHTLTAAHEGWTLCVDDGIDNTTPMTFGGCKVDRLQIECKQGGTVVLRFRIGTSDLDAERLGKLGMLHGHSMWITLKAPEAPVDAIDGSVEAFNADHPDAGEGSATDLFAQTSSGGDAAKPDSNIPDEDPFYADAVVLVRAQKRASISLIQRTFQIGYNRAARLVERMETEGVVGAQDEAGNRSVIGAGVDADSGESASTGRRTARGRDATKKALAEGLAASQTTTAA